MRNTSCKRVLAFTGAVLIAVGMSACATLPTSERISAGTKTTTELDWQPDMYHQDYLQAFGWDRVNPKLPAMRVPPVGTVPVNWVPFPQPSDVTGMNRLHDPLPVTAAVLAKGRQTFDTYCIVCHGAKATGLGYIVPKMTQPPPLIAGAPLAFTDGRIFTIISEGLGNMPSYRTELDPAERWAVIHYVRVLQRAANPSASDLARAQSEGMDFSGDLPPAEGVHGPISGALAVPHNPIKP